MTRFVLDTDIVSLLQRGDPTVAAHAGSYDPDDVATTIISFCCEKGVLGVARLMRFCGRVVASEAFGVAVGRRVSHRGLLIASVFSRP